MSAAASTASVVVPVPSLVPKKLTTIRCTSSNERASTNPSVHPPRRVDRRHQRLHKCNRQPVLDLCPSDRYVPYLYGRNRHLHPVTPERQRGIPGAVDPRRPRSARLRAGPDHRDPLGGQALLQGGHALSPFVQAREAGVGTRPLGGKGR